MLFGYEDNTYTGIFYQFYTTDDGYNEWEEAFTFSTQKEFFEGLYKLYPYLKKDDRGCNWRYSDTTPDDCVQIDISIGLDKDEEPIETMTGLSFLKDVGFVDIYPDKWEGEE